MMNKKTLALIILVLSLPLLVSCGDQLKWYVVSPETKAGRVNLMFMMSGLKYTLLLSIVAIVISFVLGLLVALPGLSERRSLKMLNRVYVEIFRSIPLLVGIFWVHYGLPILTGVTLSPFWSAVSEAVYSQSIVDNWKRQIQLAWAMLIACVM